MKTYFVAYLLYINKNINEIIFLIFINKIIIIKIINLKY